MISPQSERRATDGGGYGYGYASPKSKNKQVEQILDVLYRRRTIIIAAFVLVTLAAIVYSFTQEATYQANALVMVDLQRMPGGETVTPEGETPFVRSDRSIASELFVLQNSHSIAQRVNQRLEEMHEEDPDVPYPIRGNVQFAPASRSLDNALRVGAVSRHPREAALLANIYAEEYVRQTRDASRGYITQANDFLREQAERRREELRDAEDAVESYMERTGAVGLNQAGGSLVARIANLEAQRDEARIDLQMRESQYSSLNQQLENISPQLARRMASDVDRRMAAIQQELAQLEIQRRETLAFETTQGRSDAANDPRVRNIDREIRQLQSEMEDISSSYVEEAMATGGVDGGTSAVNYAADLKRQAVQEQINMTGLESRIETMNRRLSEYQGELSNIPSQSTELARLERTRQHAEQMYQFIVQRLQETQIAMESEPG